MWPVPRPHYAGWDVLNFYGSCIVSNRSEDSRTRLIHLGKDVREAAERYESAAYFGELHRLKDLENQPDDAASRLDLLWAYTRGLVQNATGRRHYDELLARAPQGRCPFCGHRDVSTLDHQLPKASYPLLAVVPDNLVPSCSECNHRKNDAVAPTTATQILHPYFEHASNGRWLFARVVSLDPPALLFFAEPDSTFTATMQGRIRHQFTQFRLATLYGTQASRQVAGERLRLNQLRQEGGPAAVREHLRATAHSWAATSLNCWQHAMYEALATDSGFLNTDS
ncbi:HNH endonuclease [Micromonospora inaquosa]|uniref:HNH endonuclease n=1 Tax=Micromonospora inaquosa TaxID=2203716 RepID=UPI000F5DE09C|nr:HNH endonuclease signature motif containing protein [Micromonospora inaquosa]